MGIAYVAGLVLRAISLLGTLLGIANSLDSKPVAEEGHPFEIQTAVLATGQYVVDPVLGIPRVISNQAALLAALGSVQTALLAAIGTPAQASVAPSWWIPPSGGGSAPTADENASAVWGFLAGGQALEMGALLEEAGNLAVNTARAGGIPSQFSPWLRLLSPLDTQHDDAPDFGPLLRADHILLADTVLTWAQREAPTYGWFLDSSSHAVMGNYPSPNGAWFLLIDLDPGQFQAIKAALGLIASGVGAPVWPGIAGVTLGAPVALSPTCVVTGPMHGVIIEITSAAPRQVYQVFGGMQGYRFVGGLQFVDDNGEAERIQSIGMQHEVIVCKSMAEAASCSIRTDSAVTGTATPFVIG